MVKDQEIAIEKPNAVEQQPTHAVFLSYRRANTNEMRQVRDTLRSQGLSVWTDESLVPGTPSWKGGIESGLENCQVVVLCLSKTAIESPWVKREVLYAQFYHKRIFPIIVADTSDQDVWDAFLTWVKDVNYPLARLHLENDLDLLVNSIYAHIQDVEGMKFKPLDGGLGSQIRLMKWLFADPRGYIAQEYSFPDKRNIRVTMWHLLAVAASWPFIALGIGILLSPGLIFSILIFLIYGLGMFWATSRIVQTLSARPTNLKEIAKNIAAPICVGILMSLTIVFFVLLLMGSYLLYTIGPSLGINRIVLSNLNMSTTNPITGLGIGSAILVVYACVIAAARQVIGNTRMFFGFQLGLYGTFFVVGRFGSDLGGAGIGFGRWVFSPAVMTLIGLILVFSLVEVVSGTIRNNLRFRRSTRLSKSIYYLGVFCLVWPTLVLLLALLFSA